jgi:predicted TPR repeat methyltransferase
MDRIDRLKDFIEKFPDDMFSRHALSMEYLKLGDEAAAEIVMKDLLDHDPRHIGTYYHLGKLMEKSGRMDAAAEVYETGIRIAMEMNAQHDLRELKGALILIKDEDE